MGRRTTRAIFLTVYAPVLAVMQPFPCRGVETSRRWTSANGAYSVEATLVAVDDEMVRLQRKDGKEISVALSKLCASDRLYALKQAKPNYSFETAEEFLVQSRKLRASPQCKLLAYIGQEVEWRCTIYDTSRVGLDLLVAHLPGIEASELEIRIWTAEAGIANAIWPVLMQQRHAGLKPSYPATIKGRVTAIHAATEDDDGNLRPAEVMIAAALIKKAPSQYGRPPGKEPDLLACRRFLNQWKAVDKKDPLGILWQIDQFREAGYNPEKRYYWKCTVKEKGINYLVADLAGSRNGDAFAHIMPRDWESSEDLNSHLPQEVVVSGKLSLGGEYVILHDAELLDAHGQPLIAN